MKIVELKPNKHGIDGLEIAIFDTGAELKIQWYYKVPTFYLNLGMKEFGNPYLEQYIKNVEAFRVLVAYSKNKPD